MGSLTKAKIAEKLSGELDLNKDDAREIVKAFFDLIRQSLSESQQVNISGFGNFQVRDKSQRPGRNPKTGRDAIISARRVVTFRPGQKLKEQIEGSDE